MDLKFSKVTRKGPITIVTLSRPEVYNALHIDAHFELNKIFDDFSADPEQWVAIVTGAGDKAFCAGNDLKWQAAGGKRGWDKGGFAGLTSRFDCDKPIIAAVNGFAMGGGCELALSCDLRIASENAVFGLPEPTLGIIPAAGGTQRLPRVVGLGRAKEMILTGAKWEARRALEFGLVSEVVPGPELMNAARAMASRVIALGPLAIRLAKQALNASANMPLQSGLAFESMIQAVTFESKDKLEGASAFLEKRKPNFTGE